MGKSKGWKKVPNAQDAPEKWGVYNNDKFEWRLMIKSEASRNEGLANNSYLPRFDARLDKSGDRYINPFSGKTGDKEVGRHLLLDREYW